VLLRTVVKSEQRNCLSCSSEFLFEDLSTVDLIKKMGEATLLAALDRYSYHGRCGISRSVSWDPGNIKFQEV
jgi:hypothetical protein